MKVSANYNVNNYPVKPSKAQSLPFGSSSAEKKEENTNTKKILKSLKYKHPY